MNPVVKALVAEDEAYIAEDLGRRLARLWPELEIVATVTDGLAATAVLGERTVDVVFLDIKMPGRDGLQVAASVDWPCLIVFVTAYDQFAVKAFEQAAIDYILKPVTDDRLARTVARLKARLKASLKERITAPSGSDIAQRQQILGQFLEERRGKQLKWVRASLGNSVRLIAVEDICYFEAKDKYTSVWTADHESLIREPLKDLEDRLDPDRFWRVHRSFLVNISHIEAAEPNGDGTMNLRLRLRKTTIPVSRRRASLFRFRGPPDT